MKLLVARFETPELGEALVELFVKGSFGKVNDERTTRRVFCVNLKLLTLEGPFIKLFLCF